jgi:hypothetical protein
MTPPTLPNEHSMKERVRRIKGDCPIEEVVRSRGIALMASGERLVGRCPFHDDATPSFTVYPATQSFHCFGCGVTGDVITFVQRFDHCSFLEALRGLAPPSTEMAGRDALDHEDHTRRSDHSSATADMLPLHRPKKLDHAPTQPVPGQALLSTTASAFTLQDAAAIQHLRLGDGATGAAARIEGAPSAATWVSRRSWEEPDLVLTLATAIYHQTLLRTPVALAYLRERGISLALARRCRLGYADGMALPAYLAADGNLHRAAQQCGLLTSSGGERLAHRLVIPELRASRALWMIGRVIPALAGDPGRCRRAVHPSTSGPSQAQDSQLPRVAPKYLGLAGPKALLGYGIAVEQIRSTRRRPHSQNRAGMAVPGILVVEGALDYVIGTGWKLPVPCVALVGTRASQSQRRELGELQTFAGGAPLLLALDADAPGRAATVCLAEQLCFQGLFMLEIPPVLQAKDLGDLAPQPGGRACFLAVLRNALRHDTEVASLGNPRDLHGGRGGNHD